MYSEWREVARVALLSATFLACADAHAGTLTLGIGADYASGKYGEPNTTKDFSVPISASYKEGAWRVKLTVPYIRIDGNGEVVGGREDRVVDDRRGRNSGSGSSGSGGSGSGSSGSGGGQDDAAEAAEDTSGSVANTSTSESGLGDISLSGTWSALANESLGLYIDVTARVKFGTASADKGLGTGKNDYGLHVDVDKDLGSATFSVGVGYTLIGDPDGFNYRNVVSASSGASYRLSDAFSINTYLNYRQSVRSTAPDQLDISPGISFKLNDQQRMGAYLLFGLQDGSPDFGAGVSYTHSF